MHVLGLGIYSFRLSCLLIVHGWLLAVMYVCLLDFSVAEGSNVAT